MTLKSILKGFSLPTVPTEKSTKNATLRTTARIEGELVVGSIETQPGATICGQAQIQPQTRPHNSVNLPFAE